MKVLAFIPARQGSKRIVNKNMKLFLGNPLLYYTIVFAKEFEFFDEIIVSSDDDNILSYAKMLGVNFIKRPSEYATDNASTGIAAKHTLEKLLKQDKKFDVIVTLQPTNPLRSLHELHEALQIFTSKKPDTMVSVSKLHKKIGEIEH